MLGYAPEQWDALPWWQQRMFAGRMAEWLRMERGGQPDQDVATDDDALADMGFRVTRVTLE